MSLLTNLTLSTSTIAYSAKTGDVIGTITGASPALPSISINGAPSQYEGNSGTTLFNFTVARTNSTGAATVSYSVSGTGANPANGADFAGGSFPTGTITIPDGQSSVTLSIPVQADNAVEVDEQFLITLSNPSSPYILASASATGTILNDDVIPINTAAPVVSGSTTVGNVLTTTTGTWTQSPTSFAYQWRRAGVAISGATASTYTTVSADGSQVLSCQVIATNAAGSSASAISNTITMLPVGALKTLPTANLLALWHADDLAAGSAGNTAATDGTQVSTWTDRVSGITAASPTSTYAPTFKSAGLSGKPTLRFSGNHWLTIPKTGSSAAVNLATQMGNGNYSLVIGFRSTNTDNDPGYGSVIFGSGTGKIYYGANAVRTRAQGGQGFSDGYGLTTDGTTHAHTFGYTSNYGRFFLDGTKSAELAGSALGIQPVAIGSTSSGNYNNNDSSPDTIGAGGVGFTGDIAFVALYQGDIGPAGQLQAHYYTCAHYSEADPLAGVPYFLIVDGDSQSNTGSPTLGSGGYGKKLAALKNLPRGAWAHSGKNGAGVAANFNSTTNDLIDQAPNDVDKFRSVLNGAVPIWLICGEYFNQGAGGNSTGPEVQETANLRTYMAQRKSLGSVDKIILWTSISTAKDGAERDAFNASLMNNKGVADIIIPIHTDTLMGVNNAYISNPSYYDYSEGQSAVKHPSDAGSTNMANIFNAGF